MIKEKILTNGLKVLSYKKNSYPVVSIQLYVRIGGALENDNESGFSHLTEHLVFKSTKKFPDNSVMQTSAWLGGNINAYTEYDSTCFFITLPSKHLEKGLEIISELVMNANFNDEEFYKEKQVVIQEKYQYEDDPEDSFIEAIAKDYFTKNRYGKPILGEYKILENAKPQQLRDFYKKYYRPNNAFLLVTGDFEENTLYKKTEKYFGNWTKKAIKKIPYQNDDWKSGFRFVKKDIQDDYLGFVFPELSEKNPESHILSAAFSMFAGGKKSRLYERLFTKEQLIDAIKIQSLAGVNDGISIIMVLPKNGASLTKIFDIFIEERNKILKNGFTIEELSDYKKEQIFNFRYSKEYMENLGMSIGMEEILSTYKNYDKFPEKISSITLKKLNEVVKKYLVDDKLSIYQMGKNKLNYKKKKSLIKTDRIFAKDVWENQITSGAKLIFKKVKNAETVGIAITLPISQFNEYKGIRGINATTATMLLYGNQKRSYEEILNYTRKNGIAITVSSKTDCTTIKAKCFKEDLSKTFDILSDILFTSTFPKKHFENIQKTKISLLKKIKNYPQYYSLKLWKEFYFGKESNMLGMENSATAMKKISLSKVKDWYKTHYLAQNMNIAVVGDFDFSEVYSYIDEYFNKFKRIDYSVEKKVIYKEPEENFKIKRNNLTQAYVNIGGNAPKFDEKNSVAFFILSEILGGNADPILFNEIREKRSWAYAIDLDYEKTDLIGFFLINAIVENKFYNQTVDTIVEILTKGIDKKLISDYLPKIKTYIKGQRILAEEGVLTLASALSNILFLNKDYQYHINWQKRLDAVSTEDIMDVAKEYFTKDKLFTSVLR